MQTTHTLLSSPLAEAGACREISNNIVHEPVQWVYLEHKRSSYRVVGRKLGRIYSGMLRGKGHG